MQLDADEDGEPFFKPPAIPQSPLQQRNDQVQSEEQPSPDQHGSAEPSSEANETLQAAGSSANVEQEQ